ncbi:MAG: hypothetical protein V3U14_12450 [candidate division NC10 bacterium]
MGMGWAKGFFQDEERPVLQVVGFGMFALGPVHFSRISGESTQCAQHDQRSNFCQ